MKKSSHITSYLKRTKLSKEISEVEDMLQNNDIIRLIECKTFENIKPENDFAANASLLPFSFTGALDHLLYEFKLDLLLNDEHVEEYCLDYLTVATFIIRSLLKKTLKSLYEDLQFIDESLQGLIVDKRAYFRSIIKQLFKNMDDEHSAVNDTNDNNQLNYLHLRSRYGTKIHTGIKGGIISLAIASYW